MATTAPDNISGWKFPNEDKKKKKNQQNTTYKTSQPTPSAVAEPINTSVYKNNGGSAKTSAPSVPYEDTVAQKNMQKEVQKAAQKAKQQPKSSLDVPYKTQQTVAQKRQQQKDEQWLSLGSAQGNTKNTGTGERQNAQSYSGKMEVRSPLVQKQWNSNVSSTAPKVQAEKNTADKFKMHSSLPPKSTAPEWKNMGTDSPWNSTSTTSAQNISKQTERKTPVKSEPDFEKDFKEMWAEYGPRLMDTERTQKTSYGPNSEMANTVKINPQKNTVAKTVASPKPTVNAAGPSAEMGKAVKLEGNPQNLRDAIENLKNTKGSNYEISNIRLEGNPQAFYNALEEMKKNKGISGETASTNFIAPRGFEIGEDGKIVKSEVTNPKDRSLVQKISDDIHNIKYGMDGLNEVNHTNTYVSKDRYSPMTKEDIYSMSTDEVAVQLGKALKNVRNERADKKQERDILLFRKHLLQAEGYGEEKTAELEKQINQLDEEIAMLNIKNLKANVGYEFCQNYIKMLSEANGDDILKILNEYNHLPYFGNIADAARSAKIGVDKVSDIVSVLENTKVSTEYGRKGVSIFNTYAPKNGFRVIPDYTIDNYGFRDYRLSVTADNIDTLTPDQKNLYKALDDMPISEKTYNFLDKLPKILNNFDAEKTGRGLTAIGYGLDVFDFLCLVATDYDNTTDTVSKDTTRKVTSMITSWIGGIAGAELGAAGGAAIGTAIMPGVGTVVGGAIGAVVGAYVLSELGEDAGMYIGGLDYGPGNPIEYHLERGR